MRITILNLADKFVLKFKRLFYAQVSEVREFSGGGPLVMATGPTKGTHSFHPTVTPASVHVFVSCKNVIDTTNFIMAPESVNIISSMSEKSKNHIWHDIVIKGHVRHDKVIRWRVNMSVSINLYIIWWDPIMIDFALYIDPTHSYGLYQDR